MFGRPLRDAFSFINRCPKFQNPEIQSTWREAWAAKEDALRTRFARTVEKLNSHAQQLLPLQAGQRVFIQNQNGPHPNKWDRSGVVLENLGHDQYSVKVDSTGRITKRNRRYLRHYTLPEQPMSQLPDRYIIPANAQSARDKTEIAPGIPLNGSGKTQDLETLNDSDGTATAVQDNEREPSQAPLPSPVSSPIPTNMSSPVPVSPPVKRGPGRPPKRVHFNSMPKEAPLSSTLLPPPPVPQPVKNVVPPTIMSPSPKSTPPPSVSSPPSQTRPCRVRFATKQYDASTGKWN